MLLFLPERLQRACADVAAVICAFFVAANIMHYSEIIAMFAVNNSMKLRYADL